MSRRTGVQDIADQTGRRPSNGFLPGRGESRLAGCGSPVARRKQIRSIATPGSCQDPRMDDSLQCVFVASGEMQAQQVRAFLHASGIITTVRGEALRHTHGLTLDGLGAVQILVSPDNADQARALIASAEAGQLRLDDGADVQTPEPE
jgi:hypothetical protein